MNKLGLFLGLPSHNFSGIVSGGAFNVLGHKGEAVSLQAKTKVDSTKKQNMELSDSIHKEVMDFLRPFNERLFNLINKRCNWD